MKRIYTTRDSLQFLMHRVELKSGRKMNLPVMDLGFLMHRVELKYQ